MKCCTRCCWLVEQRHACMMDVIVSKLWRAGSREEGCCSQCRGWLLWLEKPEYFPPHSHSECFSSGIWIFVGCILWFGRFHCWLAVFRCWPQRVFLSAGSGWIEALICALLEHKLYLFFSTMLCLLWAHPFPAFECWHWNFDIYLWGKFTFWMDFLST